ncbi:MAG: hypothetical protein R2713_04550 [Ilumatobacteraceae bacterium]
MSPRHRALLLTVSPPLFDRSLVRRSRRGWSSWRWWDCRPAVLSVDGQRAATLDTVTP